MQYWQIALISTAAALLVGGAVYTTLHYTVYDYDLEAYNPEIVAAYKNWQVKFGVKETDPDQAAYRLGIFAENYKMIKDHNKSGKEYTLGINQFMTLTHEEFKSTYLGLQQKTKASPYGVHVNSGKKASGPIDWVTKGAVTPIKNQGQCGSCWSFSTTGGLEGDEFVEGGQSTPTSLSEQELVDCSGSYGNMGCNGGLMDQAFEFVIAKGITSEDNYPYTAQDGSCNSSKESDVKYQISSYKDVPQGDCDSLVDALQQQPISIGVDAETWQFYSGGVFSDCGTQLDHGVLLVGTDDDSNYVVKNSWGTSWGNQGYITLKGGKNTCGICNTASYPQK